MIKRLFTVMGGLTVTTTTLIGIVPSPINEVINEVVDTNSIERDWSTGEPQEIYEEKTKPDLESFELEYSQYDPVDVDANMKVESVLIRFSWDLSVFWRHNNSSWGGATGGTRITSFSSRLYFTDNTYQSLYSTYNSLGLVASSGKSSWGVYNSSSRTESFSSSRYIDSAHYGKSIRYIQNTIVYEEFGTTRNYTGSANWSNFEATLSWKEGRVGISGEDVLDNFDSYQIPVGASPNTVQGYGSAINSKIPSSRILHQDFTSITFDQLYLSQEEFNSLTDGTDLLTLLRIRNGELPSTFEIDDVEINHSHNLINFKFRDLTGDSSHYEEYTEWTPASLQVEIINFSDVLQISREYGQTWNYTNGKHMYTPSVEYELGYVWNKDFFDALKAPHNINDLLNDISNFSSWKDLSHVSLAIASINAYELNQDNYELWMASYVASASTEWLDPMSIMVPDWFTYIESHNITDKSAGFYAYILNGASIEFDFSLDGETYTETFSSAKNQDEFIVDTSSFDFTLSQAYARSITLTGVKFSNSKLNVNTAATVMLPASQTLLRELNKIDIAYSSGTNFSITYNFRYQLLPLSVDQDITFTGQRTGNRMNDTFRILDPFSGNPIGSGDNHEDYGWDVVKYALNESTGLHQAGYYVFIKLISGEWYLSDTTINADSSQWIKLDDIMNSSTSFDPDAITYLFSEELHLTINPYSFTGEITAEKVANSIPRYGIRNVVNTFNNQKIILEDWEDGGWNHITDPDGYPLVDGIFGTDVNGNMDDFAVLSHGTHEIDVELYHSMGGIETAFVFEIDTSLPVVSSVEAEGNVVIDDFLWQKKDGTNEIKNIHLSDRPILFEISDPNLVSVGISFSDSSGNWYSFPLKVNREYKDGKYTLIARTLFNYQGFIKFTVVDAAGNTTYEFSYLNSSNNYAGIQNGVEVNSSTQVVGDMLLASHLDGFNGSLVDVYNTSSPDMLFVDADPTHTNVTVREFQGYLKYQDGDSPTTFIPSWAETSENSDVDTNHYIDEIYKDYFGRPIPEGGIVDDNGLHHLVGDELKIFLKNFDQVNSQTLNETSSWILKPNTLYKVDFESLISSLPGKHTYYLWTNSEGNISNVTGVIESIKFDSWDELFPEGIPEGYDEIIIDAIAREDVKNSSSEYSALEKEAFAAQVYLIREQVRLESLINKNMTEAHEALGNLTVEVDDNGDVTEYGNYLLLKKEITNSIQTLEEEISYQELTSMAEWISINYPSTNLENIPETILEAFREANINNVVYGASSAWVGSVSQYNSYLASVDYLNKLKIVNDFELNVGLEVQHWLDILEEHNNAIDDGEELVKEKQAEYDDLLLSWYNSIVFTSDSDLTSVSLLLLMLEEVDNGRMSVAPVLPVWNILTSHTASTNRMGYAQAFNAETTASSISELENGQTWIIDYIDEDGNQVQNQDIFTILVKKLDGTVEARNNIDLTWTDNLGVTGVIYSGKMLWNGYELEDWDHMNLKKEMFISQDPERDPEDIWDDLEDFNKGESENNPGGGIEIPDPIYSSTSSASIAAFLTAFFGGTTGFIVGTYLFIKRRKGAVIR